MKKIIKRSNRGLTFSFDGKDTKFNIGSKFKYIIEAKTNRIYIVPSNSDTKSLTISKKKIGKNIKSLIDLRSKKVLNSISKADLLEISIEKNTIVINLLNESNSISRIKYKEKGLENSKIIDITQRLEKVKKLRTIYLDKSLIMKDKVSGENYSDEIIFDKNNYNECDYSSSNIEEIINGVRTTIKVVSLFSGCGLFDYPLYLDKNFEIIKAVELNKSACDSYRENLKGVNLVNEDIKNFKVDDSIKTADCLWGGCPCRPYSNENRVNRLDKHNDIDLLNEYIRIVKEGKFKTFVLENVPQIISVNGGKYFNKFKSELNEYNISHIVLQDNLCGGYTTRKRAFIFGSKIGKISLNYIKKKGKIVRDALRKVTAKWFNYLDVTKPSKKTEERMKFIPMGGNWRSMPKELWEKSYEIGKTHSNTYRRLDINQPSVTLANFRKCNLIHPIENRGLSVAEASAISGFNQDIKFLGTLSDRQQQVANGVPFFLGQAVKSILKNFYFKKIYGNNVYLL